MTKAKTNALDALRTLIAERQQYDQWIATLESKRDGTSEQVFNRVYSDYRGRLDRVVGEIRSHSAELQLSITTLSARLGEVARDEETRRDAMQEAELRALVGEYPSDQWDRLREDGERELERIAADRASLEDQLSELSAIQKLSEAGSSGSAEEMPLPQPYPVLQPAKAMPETPREPVLESAETRTSETRAAPAPTAELAADRAPDRAPDRAADRAPDRAQERAPDRAQERAQERTLEPVFSAAPTPGEAEVALRSATEPQSQATARTGVERPPGSTAKRSTPTRPEQSKTLKCPECGTANYPTEWYCEKCGGELATM
jgi:hypothetical protein